MPQHARKLVIDVPVFPGFPDTQPVIPKENRVADGPVPVFGDRDKWDLAALGLSPSQKPNLAVFHFTDYPDDWNYLIRSFLMVLLNPADETLIASGVYRPHTIPKLKTLKHHAVALGKIAQWAITHNKNADLTTWTHHDLDSYYDWALENYSRSLVQNSRQVFTLIVQLGRALPSYLTFDVPALSSTYKTGEIKTRPIEPDDFWSLIHACWTYIDVFAPDILEAGRKIKQQNERFTHLPQIREPVEVRRRLDQYFRSPDAFVPLHCSNRGPGTKGHINWESIARIVDFRLPNKKALVGHRYRLRSQIVYEAIDRGVPTRYGTIDHIPVSVTRTDGSAGPWCLGFDSTFLNFEATKLRAACFIFITALSMMRLSEVSGLECGSLTTYYGAPALKGAVYKHQAPTGKPDYWWVSEPVAQAVAVAEELTGGDGLLFQSVKLAGKQMDHRDEVHRFIEWINKVGPQRGLRPIKDPAISAHRLRRTMAIITASQPDGEIALGISLKHNATRALANSVTSGYGAPSVAWGRALNLERASATAAELISDWSKLHNGQLTLHGPGARRYNQILAAVDEKQTSKAFIGDERMLRELLRDQASGITLGTLNHCLGDPTKAECLRGLDDESKKAGPIMAACSPTRCRNSVITDKHLPVWLAEEDELKKLLRDRRMALSHRHQLEHQLKDIQRVTKSKNKEQQ